MDLQAILDFLFPGGLKNPGGSISMSPGVEAQAAAMVAERDQKRAAAELAAQQAAGGAKGPGAKRKLTPEEEALNNLLNSPRGQSFGR